MSIEEMMALLDKALEKAGRGHMSKRGIAGDPETPAVDVVVVDGEINLRTAAQVLLDGLADAGN